MRTDENKRPTYTDYLVVAGRQSETFPQEKKLFISLYYFCF
jgi:hypothetical protein